MKGFGNVLVTGGSGFLGRRIVGRLERLGYGVTAPRSAAFDLETGRGVGECFEKCRAEGRPVDAVIHSAAYYGGIGINMRDPAGLITRNTRMTVTVFENAAKFGVRKVVSVGSACAYPGHLTDILEERDIWKGACHDSIEAYGFNKRIHLVFGKAYCKQHGIGFNQVALTNLYGEHDVFGEARSHVISALIKKVADARLGLTPEPVLWGTGSPKREFAYVQDAADVIVDALNWETDFEPVNLNGEEVTIRALAEMICRLIGYGGALRWDSTKPDGVARKCLSGEKLARVLTFAYRPLSLEAGLQRTIEWYMANKSDADSRQ